MTKTKSSTPPREGLPTMELRFSDIIRSGPHALPKRAVDREGDRFKTLYAAIKADGMDNPPTVRPITWEEDGVTKSGWQLVAGGHRCAVIDLLQEQHRRQYRIDNDGEDPPEEEVPYYTTTVTVHESESEAEARAFALKEDITRAVLTMREQTDMIGYVHNALVAEAKKQGKTNSQRDTAAFIGVLQSTVANHLTLGKWCTAEMLTAWDNGLVTRDQLLGLCKKPFVMQDNEGHTFLNKEKQQAAFLALLEKRKSGATARKKGPKPLLTEANALRLLQMLSEYEDTAKKGAEEGSDAPLQINEAWFSDLRRVVEALTLNSVKVDDLDEESKEDVVDANLRALIFRTRAQTDVLEATSHLLGVASKKKPEVTTEQQKGGAGKKGSKKKKPTAPAVEPELEDDTGQGAGAAPAAPATKPEAKQPGSKPRRKSSVSAS